MMKYWEEPTDPERIPWPMSLSATLAHLLERAHHHGWPGAVLRTKVNANGALVVALILPERVPGEWSEPQRAIDARAAPRRQG